MDKPKIIDKASNFNGNLTRFTNEAQKVKLYTFSLMDELHLHGYSVVRNGASVYCIGTLTLPLNPEDLVRERPARNNVTQTPHGAWVDSFDNGLVRWTMRGSTGWKAHRSVKGVLSSDSLMDGYMAYHVFAEMIEVYFAENRKRAIEAAQAGRQLKPPIQLVFHDRADDDYWLIEPDGVPTKKRSKDRPLLYDYEFAFTGIIDLKISQSQIADPIGEALIGSDSRDQLTADAFRNSIPKTNAAIGRCAAAAAQNPGEAGQVDSITNKWITRDSDLLNESFDGWQQADVQRVLSTAGNPSEVFATPTAIATNQTLVSRCKALMTNVQALGTAVSDYRNKFTTVIAMPFKQVTEIARGVRDMMNAIAFASSAFTLGAQFRTALRTLRTELRNLFCAVQSLLAFPYNFVKGLKDTLQTFLNLFKLSGCATTFPRIKPLSWQPSASLKIPSPTGG